MLIVRRRNGGIRLTSLGVPSGPGRGDAGLLTAAQAQRAAADGAKVRLAGETTYQAGNWERAQRVMFQAEVLAGGRTPGLS